jgi:Permuted papain-like amidase enzyme, YaeF/YiiX, C92 family
LGDLSHQIGNKRYPKARFGFSSLQRKLMLIASFLQRWIYTAVVFVSICCATAQATAASSTAVANAPTLPSVSLQTLAPQLAVGDLVFIRVAAKPFLEVADATLSWTNHVGVVVDVSGAEPLVAESTIPWSRTTGLSRFVARSQGGRFAVSRLSAELTAQQKQSVTQAAAKRSGVLYDTGFDLTSKRQFCSRFVREVLLEATGKAVGEVETFERLLSRNPDTRLGFWRVWYFGSIPWSRTTVTPASVLTSPELQIVFDGVAHKEQSH